MRCDNCNKFVSLDCDEPEVENEDFDGEAGRIDAEYRIIRTCSDCGQEMKEATITFDEDISDKTEDHQGEGHELSAEFDASLLEEGGGRYKKSYFGVDLKVTVTCSCGDFHEVFDYSDKVAASEMDELL